MGRGKGQIVDRPEAAVGMEHKNCWSVAYSPENEKRKWRWVFSPRSNSCRRSFSSLSIYTGDLSKMNCSSKSRWVNGPQELDPREGRKKGKETLQKLGRGQF